MTKVITIATIAQSLNLQPEDVNLPNGKVVKSIVWRPDHLPQVFEVCDGFRREMGVGKNDLVVIDGVGPSWLVPTVTHAFHPTSTAVSYPQGGPGATLPISGTQIDGAGSATDVSFTVTEGESETVVEFNLTSPQIDALATIASLVAPTLSHGKPVKITGRGPTAIAAALAEAYAHVVPYVALFQPGTGFVVAISHSDVQLGTVFQA
jgi:hypothetical protein